MSFTKSTKYKALVLVCLVSKEFPAEMPVFFCILFYETQSKNYPDYHEVLNHDSIKLTALSDR